jgi:hypothetical protein
MPAEGRGPSPSEGEKPAPEIRIDRLLVGDIDFTFQDRSATPVMTVPLAGLDVDVRNITTRALLEPQEVRFNVLLNSGKVSLPKLLSRGAIDGVVSDTVDMVVGDRAKGLGEREDRKFFEEITASGKIALHPHMNGWVKAGVSALDLTNCKGPASTAGVTLDKGILDANIDLRFRGDGSMDTEARFTFTDLSLSEPPDGPIVRYLKLPAPLDAVLFILRDEDGAIEVPLSFHMGADGLSAGEAAKVAVKTLGTLIANAIASSPFRVAGAVVDMVALGGEEKKEGDEEPIILAFNPGDTFARSSELARLAPLLDRFRQEEGLSVTLRHELGGGDIPRTALRANPSRADCLDLASRLRRKKGEILRFREEVAEQARAAYAAGLKSQAAESSRRLLAINRELGFTERALDRILELLRPGAERQAVRRTREACVAIGRARLEAVHRALLESGIPRLGQRIRITRPRFTAVAGAGGGKVLVTPRTKKAP